MVNNKLYSFPFVNNCYMMMHTCCISTYVAMYIYGTNFVATYIQSSHEKSHTNLLHVNKYGAHVFWFYYTYAILTITIIGQQRISSKQHFKLLLNTYILYVHGGHSLTI